MWESEGEGREGNEAGPGDEAGRPDGKASFAGSDNELWTVTAVSPAGKR